MGNPASIAEGIAAAMEAGIKIAELIEELAVHYYPLITIQLSCSDHEFTFMTNEILLTFWSHMRS